MDAPSAVPMQSVTLPRTCWRTIHAALIEMCVMWDAGAGWAALDPPTRMQVADVMQRIAPVVGLAAGWPDGAPTEARAREAIGLPVPEDGMQLARALVQHSDEPSDESEPWRF